MPPPIPCAVGARRRVHLFRSPGHARGSGAGRFELRLVKHAIGIEVSLPLASPWLEALSRLVRARRQVAAGPVQCDAVHHAAGEEDATMVTAAFGRIVAGAVPFIAETALMPLAQGLVRIDRIAAPDALRVDELFPGECAVEERFEHRVVENSGVPGPRDADESGGVCGWGHERQLNVHGASASPTHGHGGAHV